MNWNRADALLADLEVSYASTPKINQLINEVASLVAAKKRRQQLLERLDTVRKLLSEKKWAVAVTLLEKLLADFPDEKEVQSLSTYALQQLQLQQKAEHIAEVRRLLDQQRVDDALHTLEHALRAFPGQAELTGLLAYSNEIVAARERTDAVNELAKRARKLLQNGRPQEARILLNGTVQQYPDEDILVPLLKRPDDAVSRAQTLSFAIETEVWVPKVPVETSADFRTPESAGRPGADIRRPKRRIPVSGAVCGAGSAHRRRIDRVGHVSRHSSIPIATGRRQIVFRPERVH